METTVIEMVIVVGMETITIEEVLILEEVDTLAKIQGEVNLVNWHVNQGRGAFNGFNGFGRGSGRGNITCQICFKPNHTAAECRDRFNRNFIPNFIPNQGHFPVQGHFPNQSQALRAAYMATSKRAADQGWYLDSGATHHLTNNVQNLVEGKPYIRSQLLLVGQWTRS